MLNLNQFRSFPPLWTRTTVKYSDKSGGTPAGPCFRQKRLCCWNKMKNWRKSGKEGKTGANVSGKGVSEYFTIREGSLHPRQPVGLESFGVGRRISVGSLPTANKSVFYSTSLHANYSSCCCAPATGGESGRDARPQYHGRNPTRIVLVLQKRDLKREEIDRPCQQEEGKREDIRKRRPRRQPR